mmetsp:Transcript_2292/g.8299  ORF Transcript_2292/g.8299 Transcript_2292/m.8299 type:complete len:210 (+) Transcript_2292:733-1362(+)
MMMAELISLYPLLLDPLSTMFFADHRRGKDLISHSRPPSPLPARIPPTTSSLPAFTACMALEETSATWQSASLHRVRSSPPAAPAAKAASKGAGLSSLFLPKQHVQTRNEAGMAWREARSRMASVSPPQACRPTKTWYSSPPSPTCLTSRRSKVTLRTFILIARSSPWPRDCSFTSITANWHSGKRSARARARSPLPAPTSATLRPPRP